INKNILIDVWKKALVFSSPLLLWAIFGWLRDSSLRWFIEIHLGTKEVAIFTAISSIAIVIPMAIQSVTSAYIIPILYQNDQGQEKKRVRRVFDKLMYMLYFLGGVIFLFLYLFSEYAVLLITDEKYIAYSWALPWMFVSYYLFCCGMLNASQLLVDFKPQKLLLPNLVSGLVILISGTIFVSDG
ncbi:TPA: lipopolysaccharide biosynthesis protein, partial [Vibrio cholerae]